jgi:hypothetical protein
MAYLLVCGATPCPQAGAPVEVLHAHIHAAPRAPSALVSELPASFEALVLELLAKDPTARPSLANARRRLSGVVTAPITGPTETVVVLEPIESPPTAPEPQAAAVEVGAPAGASRRRRWIAAAGIAAAALSAVAVVAIRGTDRSDATPLPPAATTAPIAAPPTPPAEPPTPETGTLDLALEPPGAAATIDGAAAKVERGRALIELAPGDHVLRVSAPGHRAHEQRFAIVRAQVTPLEIQLPRLPVGTGPKPRRKVDPDAVVNPFDRTRKP